MPSTRPLLCLGLFVAACSGAEVRSSPPGPSATGARAGAAPEAVAARWEVHPTPMAYVTGVMRLADGRCLVIDHGGDRWLTSPARPAGASPVSAAEVDPSPAAADGEEPYSVLEYNESTTRGCSGVGRAAQERAPEPLLEIVRWGSSYGFVGESGTIHEAVSPLGKFTRRIKPPEPVTAVRGSGQIVLALTARGRVLRWDDERGYVPTDVPEGVHAFDLAVAPPSRAVVLAAPEAIFTTEDGGKTFQRASAPSIGAQRAGRIPGGPLLVEGVGAALAWSPREPAKLAPSTERLPNAIPDVVIEAGRSPRGDLVSDGRAALDGDRYWEVGVGASTAEWTLWRGKLDGQISATPARIGGPSTSNILVAARGKHVAIAVIGWEDGMSLELRRSSDEGATFGPEIPLILSELAPLGMAVAPDGSVLVTGTCPATGSIDAESCAGGPLIYRNDPAPVTPRADGLRGPALAPAFSEDGRSAYFLAKDEDSAAASLFVSHDGGASFEERTLRIESDGEDRTFDIARDTAITVSPSGVVGMALERSGDAPSTVWVTTDADGRRGKIGEPPISTAVIGGSGERVLAVQERPATDAEDDLVWESLDGGATWRAIPAPEALRTGYRRPGDLACGAAGCLVGYDVARIGWGGEVTASLPFEPPTSAPLPKGLRPAIVCEPRPGSTWTKIDDVADPRGLPDISSAARGKSAWMVSTVDARTGAASVVVAELPDSGDGDARIVTRKLLGPIAKGTRHALALHPQIEGVAMARLVLPRATAGGSLAGLPMKNLEIAWENLEEGTSSRAVLPDAGKLTAGTVAPPVLGPERLILDELSVSPNGIFVRALDGKPHFVDTSGKPRSFVFPGWPASFETDARPDSSNVDGTFVVTGFHGGRGGLAPLTLVLARPPSTGDKPGAAWPASAATLAPTMRFEHQQHTVVSFDWTYDGGHLALAVLLAHPSAGHGKVWISRIQADGTLASPSLGPTPFDLPATPRPCTPAEHASLPRLRIRSSHGGELIFPGTRHPLLVDDGSRATPDDVLTPDGAGTSTRSTAAAPAAIGREILLTNGVVIRGSPASPCVDAFAAGGVERGDVSVIVTGDLRRGWYFRRRDDASSGGLSTSRIEVRPLTCRFDPSAPLPVIVHEAAALPD